MSSSREPQIGLNSASTRMTLPTRGGKTAKTAMLTVAVNIIRPHCGTVTHRARGATAWRRDVLFTERAVAAASRAPPARRETMSDGSGATNETNETNETNDMVVLVLEAL